MKIGILACGYNCNDFLEQSLKPWVILKDKYNIEISVVSTKFKEFQQKDNQSTLDTLMWLYDTNEIDNIVSSEDELLEHEARNLALNHLKMTDCDYIWLLDVSDELYTVEEIEKTIAFIEHNHFSIWFSIEFKNYIFTEKSYIDGFKPPRIFKTKDARFQLVQFYWDNDPTYIDMFDDELISYKSLSNILVPKNVCNPKHYTWLDNERSKDKIEYQTEHFKGGAGCSFKWENGHLAWNEEYFTKTNTPKPILQYDR